MTIPWKMAVRSISHRHRRLVRLIDRTLRDALPRTTRTPAVIRQAMRYCVFSGGKRFRPLLCLGACEAVGQPARRALAVASAIELIHTYSLVHDDLPAMDNAQERRGRPSCHRRFGEGAAILAGDALLTLAFHLVSRNGTPNTLMILRTMGQASGAEGLIGGQALDLEALRGSRIQTPRRLLRIAQRKTADLITASVLIGAMAGGASAAQITRLRRYGQDIGLAFQLIDDVHDGEGLAQAMGVDAARRKAQRLIDRSRQTLEPFGTRAEVLHYLSTWLTVSS